MPTATVKGKAGGAAVVSAPAVEDAPGGEPEVRLIPLADIADSPWNPRKHYDAGALEDLADSMRVSGQLEAALVRPHVSGHGLFELAAGHRRTRAARMIGKTHLLCIVRPMDDATMLEVLTVSNLQREDIHPLEEADGYAAMMKELGWDEAKIASRVKKGLTYVYDRLSLLRLIVPARELFFNGRMTASHATELARLTADDQVAAIDSEGGLWREDEGDDDPELALGGEHSESPKDPYRNLKLASVREFRDWVRQKTYLDPEGEHVASLFPEVAAAVARAKAVALPIVRISLGSWVDGQTPQTPAAERILTVREYKIIDDVDGLECDHMSLGVVVVGRGQGHRTFRICAAHTACADHWKKEIAEARRLEKEREKAKADRQSSTPSKPVESAWQKEQRLRAAAAARFDVAEGAVRTALASAIKRTSVKPDGPLEKLLMNWLSDIAGIRPSRTDAWLKSVPRGKTADELVRHLVFAMYCDPNHLEHDGALEMGKALGVDVKKLVDAAQPKAEKPAAAKKAAPSKAKPAKKTTTKKKAAR